MGRTGKFLSFPNHLTEEIFEYLPSWNDKMKDYNRDNVIEKWKDIFVITWTIYGNRLNLKIHKYFFSFIRRDDVLNITCAWGHLELIQWAYDLGYSEVIPEKDDEGNWYEDSHPRPMLVDEFRKGNLYILDWFIGTKSENYFSTYSPLNIDQSYVRDTLKVLCYMGLINPFSELLREQAYISNSQGYILENSKIGEYFYYAIKNRQEPMIKFLLKNFIIYDISTYEDFKRWINYYINHGNGQTHIICGDGLSIYEHLLRLRYPQSVGNYRNSEFKRYEHYWFYKQFEPKIIYKGIIKTIIKLGTYEDYLYAKEFGITRKKEVNETMFAN